MKDIELHIKNMVCRRCIDVVTEICKEEDMSVINIILGRVNMKGTWDEDKKLRIKASLSDRGFELLDDERIQIVNKIRTLVIQHARQHDSETKLSVLLTREFNRDYYYLSRLFSQVEGRTIEKFYIAHKVEAVKEQLRYGVKSISEIAYDLGFSNPAHLSSQFKNVTGMTPTQFRKNGNNTRTGLDKV